MRYAWKTQGKANSRDRKRMFVDLPRSVEILQRHCLSTEGRRPVNEKLEKSEAVNQR